MPKLLLKLQEWVKVEENQEKNKFMWGIVENSQIDELFNKDNANY